MAETHLHPLSILYLNLSEKFDDDEVNKIKNLICGNQVQKRTLQGLKSLQDILQCLQQKGFISETDLGLLKELLKAVGRTPLIELVNKCEEELKKFYRTEEKVNTNYQHADDEVIDVHDTDKAQDDGHSDDVSEYFDCLEAQSQISDSQKGLSTVIGRPKGQEDITGSQYLEINDLHIDEEKTDAVNRHSDDVSEYFDCLEAQSQISDSQKDLSTVIGRPKGQEDITGSQYLDFRGTLLSVAEQGNVHSLKHHLKTGLDINCSDEDGNTALILASKNGHRRCVEFLLKNKANIVHRNKEGQTSLHFAVRSGQHVLTRLLLEYKASIDAKDKEGQTPLHIAVKYGQNLITRLLLESKASTDVQDMSGQTALHLAAASDGDVTTRLLLEFRASIDVQDNNGRTPLDITHGRKVKSLLKAAKKKAKFTVLMTEPGMKRNRRRLFVCGFGGVGKTTLMNALQRGFLEAYLTRRPEERAPPPDKTTHIPTPGIDVNMVKIPTVGKYGVWEFAGQPEYYVTHNIFLRADDSVFLVVFRIIDVIDDFDGTLTEELLTWPRFIKSRISNDLSTESKPTVILVASGADMVEKPLHDHAIKVFEEIRTRTKEIFGKYLDIVDETFLLNCHDSRHKDMDRLRICLSDCKRKEQIPKLCAKIAADKNKWQINEKFPIWYWPAYVEQVKKIDPLVEEDFLRTATSYLDKIGELLFIKNPYGDDIIVLNIQWLCSRVFGPMLATEIFLQYSKKLRKNQKFYSRSDIDEVFSEFADTGLLLKLLKIFELVFEADHSPSVSVYDTMYIAPALLVENMPESQWRMDPSKQIYFGRRVQCRDETDSFSPGLFPRLQARLYNHFRDQSQSPIGIWKNGIKVCRVVECLVYMTRGWRAIHICVRAHNEENIGDCHNLLNMVSEQINDVLEICSPGSDIESHVLSAHSLRIHTDPNKTKFFSMRKILEAEAKGVNVYDEESGDEEAATELLSAGHDTTLLRCYGYKCDVKWMMYNTLKKFCKIMDVTREVSGAYRAMADLMGIAHTEVLGWEGKYMSMTNHILSEWSKRWEMRRRSGGSPAEGDIVYESTFSNLIKILNDESCRVEPARHEIVEMFRRLGP